MQTGWQYVAMDRVKCKEHNFKLYLLRYRQLVYYYYYHIHLTAFFQDNLGKPAPER